MSFSFNQLVPNLWFNSTGTLGLFSSVHVTPLTLVLTTLLMALMFQYIQFILGRNRIMKHLSDSGFVYLHDSHPFWGDLAMFAPQNGSKTNVIPSVLSRVRFALTQNTSLPAGIVVKAFHPYFPLGRFVVVPIDASIVKHITKAGVVEKHTVKGDPYKLAHSLIGHGVLVSEGDTWKRSRRIIDKALSPQSLNGHLDEILDIIHTTLARWKQEHATYQNNDFDVLEEIQRMTLRVISRVGFGVDSEKIETNFGPLSRLFYDIVKYLGMISHVPLFIATSPLYPGRISYNNQVKELDRIIQSILESWQASLENNSPVSGCIANSFVESGVVGDRQQMADEIKTLLFAGYDTTSSALSWSIYILGTKPDVAEILYREVVGICKKGDPTIQELNKLSYLDAFVKEILRVYPSAAFLKNVTRDIELPGRGILPSGTAAFVLPHVQHLNETYFPDSMEFKPARWLEDKARHGETSAYIPFSTGPRNCVGKRLAILELKVMILKMIQEFDFVVDDSISPELEMSLAINPVGIRARVIPRD